MTIAAFQTELLKLIKTSPAMAVSTLARQLRNSGVDVIDLSIGEPDFDTPPHVIDAALAAMKRGETRYTAVHGTDELKDAVIDKFRHDNTVVFVRDEVCVSNGAKQVIFNALMATIEPGDEVLCLAPFWVSYTDIAMLCRGTPVVVSARSENGFKISAEALAERLTPNTRWLLLNSPANPTGASYTRAEMQALGEVIAAHPRLLVLSDEIYEKIYYGAEAFCSFLAACPQLRDRVLTVNGVSKTYAMTGWRVGYAAGPIALIAAMSKIQSQSTTSACSISQAAAVAALRGPQDFVHRTVEEYRNRKDLVIGQLRKIPGMTVNDPGGTFYAFPNVNQYVGRTAPTGAVIRTDADLANYLLHEARVAVVPGTAFGAENHLRLSFAAKLSTLDAALTRIDLALRQLH